MNILQSAHTAVDLNAICEDYGVSCFSYSSNRQWLCEHGLEPLTKRTSGFCICSGGRHSIFFDDTVQVPELRFTIAHELGHIVLGHLSFRSSFLGEFPDSAEREADAFAVQLLANELGRRRAAAVH